MRVEDTVYLPGNVSLHYEIETRAPQISLRLAWCEAGVDLPYGQRFSLEFEYHHGA